MIRSVLRGVHVCAGKNKTTTCGGETNLCQVTQMPPSEAEFLGCKKAGQNRECRRINILNVFNHKRTGPNSQLRSERDPSKTLTTGLTF